MDKVANVHKARMGAAFNTVSNLANAYASSGEVSEVSLQSIYEDEVANDTKKANSVQTGATSN